MPNITVVFVSDAAILLLLNLSILLVSDLYILGIDARVLVLGLGRSLL